MSGPRQLGRYRLETVVSSAEAHAGRRRHGPSRFAALRQPHRARTEGVGDVYLARDTADRDKRVVVKLLGPQPRKEVMTALSRDIRTIAARKDTRLPVLDVVDCGEHRYALAMTYVNAPSLAELIGDKPQRPGPAVAKAAGIAAVLVEAAVPHGCLRPSNILVDGQGRVYVVGWDTARLRGGTPRPADDVRGLAIVLLSMLLGRAEVDEKAVDASEVPEGLRDVIRRALSSGDYTSVAEFVRAASEADVPDAGATPPPLPPPPPPPAPRRRWVVALSAASAVVVLVVALALFRWYFAPSPRMDVGGRPVAILAAASGSAAYVANFDDGTVTEIDGRSVSGTLRVPGHPAELALDPAGTRLYVGDPTADTVATVDLATDVVVKTVQVAGPRGMFVGPSGRLYVAASMSHSVAVVDPAGGTTMVPVQGTPVDVVAGPDAATVSVVTQEPAAVLALDTAANRVTASVLLDDALVPEGAVTAPNGIVYLSDPASSAVTVVDLQNGHTAQMPLTGRVRGLGLSADGHRLYATLEHPASLASVDLSAAPSPPEPPEPLPDVPDAVAVTADGQEVLVALPRRAQVVRLTAPGKR